MDVRGAVSLIKQENNKEEREQAIKRRFMASRIVASVPRRLE